MPINMIILFTEKGYTIYGEQITFDQNLHMQSGSVDCILIQTEALEKSGAVDSTHIYANSILIYIQTSRRFTHAFGRF